MKASKVIEQLLIVLYKISQKDGTVRQYGIYPWNLTDESGIQFDDAGDALAAVNRMKARGWIKAGYKGSVELYHSVRLTEQGIEYAEELLKPFLIKHLREIIAIIGAFTRTMKHWF